MPKLKKKGQRKQKVDDKFKTFKTYNFDYQLIRYMPRDFLRNLNLREFRGLVRISVN